LEETTLIHQFLKQRDAILAFIFALTGNFDVAEEVFQEVGLAVTTEGRQGREVDNFMAWIREVARRRVSAYYRIHGRTRAMLPWNEGLVEVIDQCFLEQQETQAETKQHFGFLYECMQELAGRNRQVIEQKYRQGKSIAAIAESLSWKSESVKVALSRARKQLADCVKGKVRRNEARGHE
jgi:RNA polymerase sigma-70 factor (ECF subfamily)